MGIHCYPVFSHKDAFHMKDVTVLFRCCVVEIYIQYIILNTSRKTSDTYHRCVVEIVRFSNIMLEFILLMPK